MSTEQRSKLLHLAEPEDNWIPLHSAPFLTIPEDKRDRIDASLRNSPKAPPELFGIEWTTGLLLFRGDDREDAVGFSYPYEFNKSSPYYDWLVDLWNRFSFRLEGELQQGSVTAVARVGTPLAQQFTVVPADAWRHLEVTDWPNGVASSPSGETLYSLYVLPEKGRGPATSVERAVLAAGGTRSSPASDFLRQVALKHGAGEPGSRITGKELLRLATAQNPGFTASERTAQEVLKRLLEEETLPQKPQ